MAVSTLYQRVAENARPVNLARLALTVLVAVFFALGWLVGAVVRALALALGWALEAGRLGYGDGRAKKERP